jgi:hypothetical protein
MYVLLVTSILHGAAAYDYMMYNSGAQCVNMERTIIQLLNSEAKTIDTMMCVHVDNTLDMWKADASGILKPVPLR